MAKRNYAAEYAARNQRTIDEYGVTYSQYRNVRSKLDSDTWAELRDKYPDANDKLFYYHGKAE